VVAVVDIGGGAPAAVGRTARAQDGVDDEGVGALEAALAGLELTASE